MAAYGKWLAAVILVGACGAIFKPKRSRPPDAWSLEAAALHALATPPAAYLGGDCSAAPLPDLELFCRQRCTDIGELSLKAYCTWDCGDIKNPDLGVLCKLEAKHAQHERIEPTACADVNAAEMRALCRRWLTSPR